MKQKNRIGHMKLQLALDVLDSGKAIQLAEATQEYVDIIEIGTPLIKHEGIHILKRLREAFPDKEIMVDLKTMDVGEYESDFCYNLGADIVTVLGVADDETIKGSIKSAKKNNKKVMVDLINHPNKTERALEVEALGADYVGVHSGIDQQNIGLSPLEDLKEIRSKSDVPVIIAGGVNSSNIGNIVKENPSIVVVGGAITSAEDPNQSAKELKEMLSWN